MHLFSFNVHLGISGADEVLLNNIYLKSAVVAALPISTIIFCCLHAGDTFSIYISATVDGSVFV